LYGCESLSLALREELGVLRKIFEYRRLEENG
jgi:hypothetical protein